MVKSPVEGGDLGVKSKIELRQVKSNKKQKTTDKRIRIVHTIEFINGGSDIQILRVAVYEEEWASPASIDYQRYMCFIINCTNLQL